MTAKNNFVFARIIAEMGRQLFFFCVVGFEFFFCNKLHEERTGNNSRMI